MDRLRGDDHDDLPIFRPRMCASPPGGPATPVDTGSCGRVSLLTRKSRKPPLRVA